MILITGASGFVGGHVTRALAHRAHSDGLRLFDLQRYRGAISPGVEIVCGSIEVEADVADAVRGVDLVVHLAAFVQSMSKNAERMFRVNTAGARTLYAAAVAAGCRHFLHISSAGVYGPPRGTAPFKETDAPRPLTPYQCSKWEAEKALLAIAPKGTTLNIIRPAGIYGAWSYPELPRYRKLLRRHWSIGLEGGMVLNPAHVSDIVGAILALIAAPAEHGASFNVGGERPIPIEDLDVLIASALGVTHRRFVIPAAIAAPLARLWGPVRWIMGRPEPRLHAYARGQSFSSVIDDSAFRTRYPGVRVRTIVDGIRDHVEWARAEHLL